MSHGNHEKKLRVVFSYAPQSPLPALLSSIRAVPSFDVMDYQGTPDEIWRKMITSSPDVAVLYVPNVGDEHMRCIRRILKGTFAHILLITHGAASVEEFSEQGRIELLLIPKSKNKFDDVVSRIKAIGRKPSPSPVKEIARPLDNFAAPERQSSVMADAALANKIVAIGASTGGTEALAAFFRALKPKMPGIVVVQHMPPVFTEMFAERLNRELPFEVTEASDNVQIKPNTIHIAPGDKHLKIKKIGSSYYTVVGGTEKVSGHCPSVDRLFDSVASVAGADATGVILTGMGGDGAEGLLKMRNRGAFTLGQDEASCIVYGMPRRAYEIGAVTRQGSLRELPGMLMKSLGVI